MRDELKNNKSENNKQNWVKNNITKANSDFFRSELKQKKCVKCEHSVKPAAARVSRVQQQCEGRFISGLSERRFVQT